MTKTQKISFLKNYKTLDKNINILLPLGLHEELSSYRQIV
jgi:hypothetical protein